MRSRRLIQPFLLGLPQPCRKLLDIGIGTGAFANSALNRVGRVVGIDISPDMMQALQPSILKVQGDAHDLPFRPGYFDCVTMRNVLHYLSDKPRVIAEIARIAAPRGRVLLAQVIPFSDEISREFDWLVARDIHYPTRSEIVALFDRLEILDSQDITLPQQSVGSWLDNTVKAASEKDLVMQRHRETSDEYKRLVNYRASSDDIFVDMKHLFLKGRLL